MKKQTNCTAVPPHPSADKRLPPSPPEKAVGIVRKIKSVLHPSNISFKNAVQNSHAIKRLLLAFPSGEGAEERGG